MIEPRVASGMSSRAAYPPKNTSLLTRPGKSRAKLAIASPAQEQPKSAAGPPPQASRTAPSCRTSGTSSRTTVGEADADPVVAHDAVRLREILEEARASGSDQSSSRCEIHRPPNSSIGPSPTVAYAIRRPSSSQ